MLDKQHGSLRASGRFRWALASLVLVLGVAEAAPAHGGWPEKTVTVVVPYAAGGNTDIMARLVTEWLSNRLGHRFIVENRVGAGATLGAAYVAKAEPDGYTFLFGAAPQLLVAPLVQKVNYDARKDFAPVAIFGTGPQVLGIGANVPAKNLREFVTYAKASPGKINYASGGQGTAGHLTGALLAARAGLDMVHIPYKGGLPAVTDLLAGQVQMYFGNASELLPHRTSDKIKLIAVSLPKRMSQLPDVEAAAEMFPGFNLAAWNGFIAPAGTPRPILELLAKETVAAAKDEKIAGRLIELGIEPGSLMLADFQRDIDESRPAYEEAVKAAGLKPPE
ncbi:MAG: tripartite tricarboxylate transporter substrate binding protein [Alphaproteobacteria bacterium]|nr:tripartite tricarboxylate transporter substrate binding protein [Alphaproteobacteria bacterium]